MNVYISYVYIEAPRSTKDKSPSSQSSGVWYIYKTHGTDAVFASFYPKYPDPSKPAILRTYTPLLCRFIHPSIGRSQLILRVPSFYIPKVAQRVLLHKTFATILLSSVSLNRCLIKNMKNMWKEQTSHFYLAHTPSLSSSHHLNYHTFLREFP